MRTYLGVHDLRGLSASCRHAMEQEIVNCVANCADCGWVLSAGQVSELIEIRNRGLRSSRRMEIGAGSLCLLIRCFSASRYLTQENCGRELSLLAEVFYDLKGRARDRISDEALADLLFEFYEKTGEGNAEYLLGRDYELSLIHI